jgi:HPt (histidine-containing phosphotransfer) domain-containing protein
MAILDVAAGLRNLNGNEKLLDKLLGRFRDSNANMCDEIRRAMDAGDMDTAVRHAHTLKGVAASLGAPDLSEEAKNVEQQLKAGPLPAEGLAKLETELELVLDAIKTRLG